MVYNTISYYYITVGISKHEFRYMAKKGNI